MNDDETVDDAEVGSPVVELERLRLPVDNAFRGRVRNSINRRLLAGDLVDLAWHGPLAALLEILQLPFSWFNTGPRRERP